MWIIAQTDKNWINYLNDWQLTSNVNFWSPKYEGLRSIKAGERIYFKIKGERFIAGYGEFVRREPLTVQEAWDIFWERNGCEDIDAFITLLNNNGSRRYYTNSIIGSTVLTNCIFFDQYINMDANEIRWNPKTQKSFRYGRYDEEPPVSHKNRRVHDFNLVDGHRTKKTSSTNIREGQSEFRSKICKAYDNTCCISGVNVDELLEAAHIQEYINRNSHHVQNGLLLRVDLHRLYDSGLIYIDKNYTIQVSSFLNDTLYEEFKGRQITLPRNKNHWPSKEALKLRRNLFSKG